MQLHAGGGGESPRPLSQARDRPAGERPFAPWNPVLWKTRVRGSGQGGQTEAHRGGQSRRTEAPSSAQMVSRGEPGPLPAVQVQMPSPRLVPTLSRQ